MTRRFMRRYFSRMSRKILSKAYISYSSGSIPAASDYPRRKFATALLMALLNCIRELNDNPTWRLVFGDKRNARLKDHELILRFLAMHTRGEAYHAPMRDFLNEFCTDHMEEKPEVLDGFKKTFKQAI